MDLLCLLMNNHYHLVIETPDGNLSKGMRQLNGVYTQAYNKRHGRVGHVFQGRFKGILVQKDTHLLEVCRYVVLNPVRAKTIRHPRQWKWSSYSATAGMVEAHHCLTVDEILSHFSQRNAIAHGKYCEFVQAGIGSPSIWAGLEAQSLLGVEGFGEALRHLVTKKEQIREIPRGQRFVGRPTLDKLFSQSSRGKTSRDRLITKAVTDYGYSQMELASFLGLHYSTISRILTATQQQQI
jgi:putative transposase